MNWNDTPDGRAFVQDVAKRIVADLGADELEIFPELAEDFFAGELTPERVTGEDPLGFGLNETLEAISPAALASASAVVGWALGEILKAAQGEAADLIKARIKTLFTKADAALPGSSSANLTDAQLAHVRKLTTEIAGRYGLRPAKAEKLALSLVGALATA